MSCGCIILTNTCSLIRVQFIASIARAQEAADSVSTNMVATTNCILTLVNICVNNNQSIDQHAVGVFVMNCMCR